jgi:hypothetical protein
MTDPHTFYKKRSKCNSSGQVLILFLFMFIVLLGLFAVTINVSVYAKNRIRTQIAADASALAACRIQAISLEAITTLNLGIIGNLLQLETLCRARVPAILVPPLFAKIQAEIVTSVQTLTLQQMMQKLIRAQTVPLMSAAAFKVGNSYDCFCLLSSPPIYTPMQGVTTIPGSGSTSLFVDYYTMLDNVEFLLNARNIMGIIKPAEKALAGFKAGKDIFTFLGGQVAFLPLLLLYNTTLVARELQLYPQVEKFPLMWRVLSNPAELASADIGDFLLNGNIQEQATTVAIAKKRDKVLGVPFFIQKEQNPCIAVGTAHLYNILAPDVRDLNQPILNFMSMMISGPPMWQEKLYTTLDVNNPNAAPYLRKVLETSIAYVNGLAEGQEMLADTPSIY